MNSNDDEKQDASSVGLAAQAHTKLGKPNQYRVLLINDDYTPMDFVIDVLQRYFRKSKEEAFRVMLTVHRSGVGECGVYNYEIAEEKVIQVMSFARKHKHPLQCVLEKK